MKTIMFMLKRERLFILCTLLAFSSSEAQTPPEHHWHDGLNGSINQEITYGLRFNVFDNEMRARTGDPEFRFDHAGAFYHYYYTRRGTYFDKFDIPDEEPDEDDDPDFVRYRGNLMSEIEEAISTVGGPETPSLFVWEFGSDKLGSIVGEEAFDHFSIKSATDRVEYRRSPSSTGGLGLYRKHRFLPSNLSNVYPPVSLAGFVRPFNPHSSQYSKENEILRSVVLSNAPFIPRPHFSNGTNELNGVENLIVQVHGWNPDSTPNNWQGEFDYSLFSDLFRGSKGYNDFRPGTHLYQALAERVDEARRKKKNWHLAAYHWELDADTGPANADSAIAGTAAAEVAFVHGIYLGELLEHGSKQEDGSHSLKKLHLIAHSAGSWAARSAAFYLLNVIPELKVQITLLDGFMPKAIVGSKSALSPSLMSDVGNYFGSGWRNAFSAGSLKLDNYFGRDIIVFGTQSILPHWDVPGRRIDVGVSAKFYEGHGGPIFWYAKTVEFPNIDPTNLRDWAEDEVGRGFADSIMYQDVHEESESLPAGSRMIESNKGVVTASLESGDWASFTVDIILPEIPSLPSSTSVFVTSEHLDLDQERFSTNVRVDRISRLWSEGGSSRWEVSLRVKLPSVPVGTPRIWFNLQFPSYGGQAYSFFAEGLTLWFGKQQDIHKTDWFQPYAAKGFAYGFLAFREEDSTTYSPSRAVSRAQMAECIYLARKKLGLSIWVDRTEPPFLDVPRAHSYYTPIQSLKSAKIVKGQNNEGKIFGLASNVTRAELCKFVCEGILEVKLVELLRLSFTSAGLVVPPDLDPAQNGNLNRYVLFLLNKSFDRRSLRDGGEPFAKILSGHPDGTFRPNDPVNRAELAKFLVNAYEAKLLSPNGVTTNLD